VRRFLLPDGLKSPEVIEVLGAAVLEGTYGTAASDPSSEFVTRYTEHFGTPPPQPYMTEAYDATFLLAMAIEKAGSTNRLAVRDALRALLDLNGTPIRAGDWEGAREAIARGETINYLGASGPIFFDENGDRAVGTVEVWKITGGDIVSERILEF